MVFSSPIFLFVFLPVLLAVYFAAPRAARNTVLLLASLLFYAWGEGPYSMVMVASITMNYAFGRAIGGREGRERRRWTAAAVAANLALLGWFKYANLVAATLAPSLVAAGRWTPVHLPIGISFFTFQALSYVLDVAAGRTRPERNPARLALFISLFPQLIAGPIVRWLDLSPSLERRRETIAAVASGIRRFTVGLGKKVLIANVLAEPADAAFGAISAGTLSAGAAWWGLACYAGQIYFDFSGYSDMAIGLGRMFGFEFPENFRHPYAASSMTDFWRRWHITLSTWFRDYLYIPLGGNRGGGLRTARNLAIVFVLCGLWHGAAWTYVVWGLWHGALLALERPLRDRRAPPWTAPLRHLYVLLAVGVGWVLFRSADFTVALAYLRAMAGLSAAGMNVQDLGMATPPVVAALLAAVIGSVRWRIPRSVGLTRAWLAVPACLVVWLLCWVRLAAGTHNPFIYFRF
ncbi:MAG: MBOAT family protein [Kiritimatiellae bacterium]|nr:MBOAT family protein [Kiritimatiellia bacterium]